MAINKNALIRYRTIDKCLQNRYRKWTLNDLIEACSDALYEIEGKDMNVGKRTVQLDIQNMRSDKLGYNAPIEIYNRKYYRYANPNYTITDIPLNEFDMDILSEAMEMLKQFKDFSLFKELDGIIQRLEDRIYTEKNNSHSIIHLDKNERLKGLEFLDVLYQAILKKVVLKIKYQSFSARKPSFISFHPYFLKEFNNRWFIIGKRRKEDGFRNLALDRIIEIDYNLDIDYIEEEINADEYYKNTIGVSVLTDEHVEEVILKVDRKNSPYVETKPFHHSQKIIERHEDHSITIQINVHHNYELERLILGFGKSIEVISPSRLRRSIKRHFKEALVMYQRGGEKTVN